MLFLAVVFVSAIAAGSAQNCPEPDSYVANPAQCDLYYQCIDGVPEERVCPDGLVFNERNEYPAFPCSYPTEVDCTGRESLQRAQPSENCHRAWGYFGSGDPTDCGRFWNCVDGTSFEVACPPGLVFDPQTYTCTWPELSVDCDVEAFFGFACPAPPSRFRLLTDGFPKYPSPKSCQDYFICINGNPRLHSCERGTVFNEEISGCDEPENVAKCSNFYSPEELADIREKKERRLLRQAERHQAYLERLANLNNRST